MPGSKLRDWPRNPTEVLQTGHLGAVCQWGMGWPMGDAVLYSGAQGWNLAAFRPIAIVRMSTTWRERFDYPATDHSIKTRQLSPHSAQALKASFNPGSIQRVRTSFPVVDKVM